MIKKKIFCLWAAALILSGCAGVFQGKEKETEPDFVLTYAENQAEDYPTTQGADKFAELVKEKTEGKVEILVNAGGSLGDEKSVIEQLQFGGIDFARVSISTVAEYFRCPICIQAQITCGKYWKVLLEMISLILLMVPV